MATVMRKNIMASIFVVILATCSVFAEEAMVNGINWRYSVSGNTACIEGFANMPATGGKSVVELNLEMIRNKICDKNLVIPGKIGKYVVTSIGERAINVSDGPASIVVPKSVTVIGTGAFFGSVHLKSISLPPKLTAIPEALFHSSWNLKAVKIPASVKSIGVEAFAECRGLKSMTIPKGVTDIGCQAFRDCSNLASVFIPASVTNIGENAFANCKKLSVIYTEAGRVEELKAVIAMHNGSHGLAKVRIEANQKFK